MGRRKTRRGTALAVINPVAGRGTGHDAFRHVEHALLDVVGDLDVRFTEAAGDATDFTREALAEAPRVLIAVGGDGTVNEVINGWFDTDGTPLAPDARLVVLPGGTGSDLARTLGLDNAAAAVEALHRDQCRLIDVGVVTCRSLDGLTTETRRFVNIASLGLSGLVNRGVSRFSSMGGPVAYAAATALSLIGWKNPSIRVSYEKDGDSKTYEGPIVTAAFANGRFFGGGMEIAPEADPFDGTLDLTLIGDLRRRDVVLLGRMLYDGSHVGHPSVTTGRATTVKVEGPDSVLLEVDGETFGRLPATFTIEPEAIRIVCPE